MIQAHVHRRDDQVVVGMLRRCSEELLELRSAIENAGGDMLVRRYAEARAIRRGIVAAGQDTSAPDFGRTPAGQTDAPAKGSGTRK